MIKLIIIGFVKHFTKKGVLMEDKPLEEKREEKFSKGKNPYDPLREIILIDARPYYKNKEEEENEIIIVVK
ncbi:MAG TPA: hypothetical protein P5548_02775 [Candidatus Moranbacteria bacterium]|nr:hypothetical protein [Candidatus Moranbacteria bacterium]HRZ33792.1 hypothetical protein [Candidatus Moranbacteria bacterium]